MNKLLKNGFGTLVFGFALLGCVSRPEITTIVPTPVKLAALVTASPLTSPLPIPDSSALSNLKGVLVFERGDDVSAHIEFFNWQSNETTPLNIAAQEAREPTWSPDMKRIAFTAKTDADRFEVRAINRDGSDEQTLVNDGSNNWYPSWSPDGLHLAFASDRSGQIQIYVSDADGQNPRQLTSTGNNWAPAWSPDSSALVFVSDRDNNRELYTIHLDGTGEHRLTNTPTDEDRPAWSPDGKKIAFMRFVEQTFLFDSSEIFIMDSDGTGDQRLTDNQSGDVAPRWSPDGKWLIFSSNRSGAWQFYLLRLADGNTIPLPWSILGRSASWQAK